MITPANLVAAVLLLIPYLGVAFFPRAAVQRYRRLPQAIALPAPALLCVPYALVTGSAGDFHWGWMALYALLPVAIALLLSVAARNDPATGENWQGGPTERGTWLDLLVLAVLGLAVDLRWFEGAWPAHLTIFNKVTLLDAGLYGFVLVRQLQGTGFDLRLRLRDLVVGLRELALYTPIALVLGLTLGFLHLHRAWPGIAAIAEAWIFTFFFIAVPEELFFRGWLQNLLERRLGRYGALLLTAALFGMAHFNKRTPGLTSGRFHWRYVVMAALAGVFYGRAWRRYRRVGASAVTHASVDAIWSLWLR